MMKPNPRVTAEVERGSMKRGSSRAVRRLFGPAR
jgi:hypothetical protein